MAKGSLQKKKFDICQTPPDPPLVTRKKKFPQNCDSENHFLITFGIFFPQADEK